MMALKKEVVGDVIAPADSAKESSHFHTQEVTFKCRLLGLPFSMLWPALLTCIGRASMTATLNSVSS